LQRKEGHKFGLRRHQRGVSRRGGSGGNLVRGEGRGKRPQEKKERQFRRDRLGKNLKSEKKGINLTRLALRERKGVLRVEKSATCQENERKKSDDQGR